MAVAVAVHGGVGQDEGAAGMPRVHGLVREGAQDVAAERPVARFGRYARGESEVALGGAVLGGVESHPPRQIGHLRHGR